MNTIPDLPARIRHAHTIFCSATGAELRLGICDAHRERAWYDFLRAEFTEEDIVLVANYLRREIRLGNRNPGALKFSNLISQLDRFEEDLQLAKAALRNAKPPPTAKDRVLEQARPVAVALPPEATANTARPVGDLIRALKDAAGMSV